MSTRPASAAPTAKAAIRRARLRTGAHDRFRRCYKLSCRVLQQDPFQKQVLPVHVCSMMRLDYHAELFYLAHQLVEEYPQQVKRAISAQYSARNSSARNSL